MIDAGFGRIFTHWRSGLKKGKVLFNWDKSILLAGGKLLLAVQIGNEEILSVLQGKKLQLCEKKIKKRKRIYGYVNHNLYKGDNIRELQ